MHRPSPTLTALAASAAVLLAACASAPGGPAASAVTIQRTAHGVAHISAPDMQTLTTAPATCRP